MAQESREATRVSFCLRKKVSTINTSPELPYALSEDGGDEDMQDGGNDITDDDYTPSVLPTSPIGRSPILLTSPVGKSACCFLSLAMLYCLGKATHPDHPLEKKIRHVSSSMSFCCSRPYTSQPHRTPFPVLLFLG